MRHKLIIVNVIFVSLLFSACTSIPLSTMWKLRNVNPIEADPALFKIAVITNELIQLQDGSTSIGLGFSSPDPKHNFNTVVNTTVTTNAFDPQLEGLRQNDERITLFSLDDEATQQLRIAQNRIQFIKDNDIQGDGSLAVNIHTGCINGPRPNKVIANIYLSIDPSQGFIKLVSNIDLLSNSNSDDAEFWVECDRPSKAV